MEIAKKYKAKIIKNTAVLHEPGKHLGTQIAKGEIYFFTDSDNILAHKNWLKLMTTPYVENKDVLAIQPQTEPPPQWNSLDRYLGTLTTDPFSWFVYRDAANPKYFSKIYTPLKKTSNYLLYKFTPPSYPLIGLSQGFGTSSKYKRSPFAENDDILSGIDIVNRGGVVAYVPHAGIYHYHVTGLRQFIHKYSWRIKNNLYQKVKGMGLVKRKSFLTTNRKIRILLFPLYSLFLPLTIIDSVILYKKSKNLAVFWHPFICLLLTAIIVKEYFLKVIYKNVNLKNY